MPTLSSPTQEKPWKISRMGYFLVALALHLVIFALIATLIVFPGFNPPTEEFSKTYVPPPAAPPEPPPRESVTVSTHQLSTPVATISTSAPTATFSIPPPDLSSVSLPKEMSKKMATPVAVQGKGLSGDRLSKIMSTEQGSWGRDRNNILEGGGDPRNVIAKFPVYLASYANGDWACNTHLTADGKIDAGSLPNLVAKMNEWSRGNITGEVVPKPLDIGGPDLMDKKPPFIFFTGHKNFVLTDQEITNLRSYLQIGGAIWGDNCMAGRGSRFDVAFRREMKRVVPDLDKNFEPVGLDSNIYRKSWFNLTSVPPGMNYFTEPLEHLDIDGKVAILYTPNDYSDLFFMRILPGDKDIQGPYVDVNSHSPLYTNDLFLNNDGVFFHNFSLPSCLAAQQLGMNIIGYLLVRFDNDLLLSP